MVRKAFPWTEKLEIREPFFLRNLLVIPLRWTEAFSNGFISLSEARNQGYVKILDTGRVEEVEVDFDGEGHLFLLDGEALQGAMQDRVTNTAVLMHRGRVRIPVSCVEEGRWAGDRAFQVSGVTAFPSLRSVLSSTVTQNLLRYRQFRSDQHKVWQTIRRSLQSLRVRSQTRSMHDLFEGVRDEVERYVETVQFPSGTTGFAALAGDSVIGLDLFGSEALFLALKDKLLRGYALDALSRAGGFTPISTEPLEQFLRSLTRLPMTLLQGVARGQELRGTQGSVTARILMDENRLIHASAFPTSA